MTRGKAGAEYFPGSRGRENLRSRDREREMRREKKEGGGARLSKEREETARLRSRWNKGG